MFQRSLTFEVTNALTPYLTLGRHDNMPELEGFEESMAELTQKARIAIESAAEILDEPETQSREA